jgi:anti-sigma B factor antagonist
LFVDVRRNAEVRLSVDVKIEEETTSQRIAMDLQLHHREKEGIQILDLQGHLIEGASEARLRAVIIELAEARTVNVILNFAGVTEIDADGLSALVFCDARLASSSGALRLLNLSRHLDLMVLTKLDTLSEVFTDEQDAVNSFFPDRAALRYNILEFVEEPEKGPAPDLAKFE